MTTELLTPGYSNISCTEDQWGFSGAVMSTEMEVQLRKRDRVFEKITIIFLTFLLKRKENYISIQMGHSISFKQLLVKEILVNGPWKLDFVVVTSVMYQ